MRGTALPVFQGSALRCQVRVHGLHAPDDGRPRVVLLDNPASLLAVGSGITRVVEEKAYPAREALDVGRRANESRPTILDNLPRPAHVSRDDGDACGERLEAHRR